MKCSSFKLSRGARLLAAACAVTALAACNGSGSGGSSSSSGSGGGAAAGGALDCAQDRDACNAQIEVLLAGLVNWVDPDAGGPAPVHARAAGPAVDEVDPTVCREEFSSREFAVASRDMDRDVPDAGELVDAFPPSGDATPYSVTVDCASGDITFANDAGVSKTVNAYTEAWMYQDADHSQMDMPSNAHYTYIRFNPTEVENAIDKDVLFARHWNFESGAPFPGPGITLGAYDNPADCPEEAEGVCDGIFLTSNPDAEDPGVPQDLDPDGIPAALEGRHGVLGTVAGVAYPVIQGQGIGGGNTVLGTVFETEYTVTAVGIEMEGINVLNTGWGIRLIKQGVDGLGTYQCDDANSINFDYMGPGDPIVATSNAAQGGSCTIDVTLLTDHAIAGTFVATLAGDAGNYNVVDGAFHAALD